MPLLVADATPLILMAKLALLDRLCGEMAVITTPAVAKEATRREDLADARYIQKLLDERRIRVENPPAKTVAAFEKQWGLGYGESSALVLAKALKAVVATDDFAAMRVARVLRLSFVTTPLLIVEMSRRGLLSAELAIAKLATLEDHAWIDGDVLSKVKELLEGGKG